MTEPSISALFARADELLEQRAYPAALAALERAEALLRPAAVGTAEQAHGAERDRSHDHVELDRRLGKALIQLNRYAEAIERLEHALHAAEGRGDVAGPTVAAIRGDLGAAHLGAGRHEDAERLLSEALDAMRSIHGEEHAATAKVLYNRGALRQTTSRYRDAIADMQRALDIRRRVLPERHPEILDSLNALGWSHVQTGVYDRAEALLSEALAGRIATLGEGHSDVAMAHLNLGTVHQMRNDYPAARRRYEQAIRITDATAPEHTVAIAAKVNLATVERFAGALDRAQERYTEALALTRKVLGERHPYVANIVTNLVGLELAAGDLDAALATAEDALALKRELLGDEHADTARAHQNLAEVLVRRGALGAALPHIERSLELVEKNYDLPYIDAAATIHLRARAHAGLGRHHEAKRDFERAIAMFEELFGAGHPLTDGPLFDYAALLAGLGERAAARDRALASLAAIGEEHRRSFAILDTRGKHRAKEHLRRRIALLADLTDSALPEEVATLYEQWLGFKGAVAGFEARMRQLRARAGDAAAALLDAYRAKLSELAAWWLTAGTAGERGAGQAAALQREIGDLEARLSERASSVEDELGAAGERLERVRTSLREGEVLLDFGVLDGRLLAFAVAADGLRGAAIQEDAHAVAEQVRALRAVVRSDDGDESPYDGALHGRLLGPFEDALAGARHLIVSPDAELAFLPFELLRGPGGRLLERFGISYVPSARELVRARRSDPPPAATPPALFGDPDYHSPAAAAFRSADTDDVPSDTLAQWLERIRLPRLTASAAEIERIRRAVPDARTYLRTDASAANLLALNGPRLLHLATHGLVFGGGDDALNPLLRALVALSGARHALRTGEPGGLVTALQISGLDLRGTELVVLSACETALGESRPGEGVAGLHQAFLAAGARTVISTLWKVPDRETAAFMAAFYARLATGAPASEALRATQLEMAAEHPPRIWAAFVAYGDARAARSDAYAPG